MNQTYKKTKEASKSFKAPSERGNLSDSNGAKYFTRKKPRPIKELKEEFK